MDIEQTTDTESFEAQAYAYIQALEVLKLSPKEGCELYGNFNVPKELQLDLKAGVYLAEVGRSVLSDRDIQLIFQMASLAHRLPNDAVLPTTYIATSIRCLEHKAWQPLRSLAVELHERIVSKQ